MVSSFFKAQHAPFRHYSSDKPLWRKNRTALRSCGARSTAYAAKHRCLLSLSNDFRHHEPRIDRSCINSAACLDLSCEVRETGKAIHNPSALKSLARFPHQLTLSW